jgi:PKD repeat protein
MRKIALLFLLCCISLIGFSQDFSNKGKEFWLAYSYHVGMVNGGGSPVMTLYLTSDVSTTYNVEIFGGAVIQAGAIAPNQVISVVIPNTYFINGNGLFTGKAIHVTAAKPIVVYSFITRSQASAATLCLPTNVLGIQYYGMSFSQLSNEANASSYITIVALENNTTVEIIPTNTTTAGWLAGSVNTVPLNKGEVYQVLGTTTGNTGVDLSGTSVTSVSSGSGGCKKIAVFSGSGKLALACTAGSADNLYQQLYPVATWGKKYLTVPSYNRSNNYYRIMRSDPSSNVTLNGNPIPQASFINGYYTFNNSTQNVIESDQPISVSQYFTSQNCLGNANPYDPDMIMLNPVEQNINRVTLVNSPLTVNSAHQHHIHLIMRNDAPGGTGRSSFRLDGNPIPTTSWLQHPNDPNYSYLYLPNVTQGNHTLISDSGFNATAYGYGNAESYGYSAGANVKDLYQQIQVISQYGIEQTPSVCTNSPFKFKVSLPYCADSVRWDISALPGPPAAPPTQLYTSCTPGVGGPDSTSVVNGRTIYWYSLPNTYNFNVTGTYPVSINTFSTNSSNPCGNEQDIDFDLQVSGPPVVSFSATPPGCYLEPTTFAETTAQNPKETYKWWWDFGDGTFSTSRNPSHTYAAPGNYTIRHSSITTAGCLSDTISSVVPVAIPDIPDAFISYNTDTVCINTTNPSITFTGSGGKLPYEFNYTLNGVAQAPVVSNTASYTFNTPVNVAGQFIYNFMHQTLNEPG